MYNTKTNKTVTRKEKNNSIQQNSTVCNNAKAKRQLKNKHMLFDFTRLHQSDKYCSYFSILKFFSLLVHVLHYIYSASYSYAGVTACYFLKRAFNVTVHISVRGSVMVTTTNLQSTSCRYNPRLFTVK